jgi:hypothetical protein
VLLTIFVKHLKIKAIILAFVFLLGGNGLSIDIAQCCDQFAGIGLSLNAHQHEDKKECCACLKMVKKKGCCDDVVVQTVINPVLGLNKAGKIQVKQFDFKLLYPVLVLQANALPEPRTIALYEDISFEDPVPILIKKRVLQI